MAEIKIYTKPGCPYCAAAKTDLDGKGLEYEEIDVIDDAAAMAEMVKVSGKRTVPVIVDGSKVTVGFGGG